MQKFEEILDDTAALSAALKQLTAAGKRLDALQLLHQAGEHGLPISRDAGNRIQGPTIWHCSRLGAELTLHFGTGPQDTCMWIGTIGAYGGEEHWRIRPQVRSALEIAGLA
jgi:hypothetical protein